MDDTKTKECSACHRVLPAQDFYHSKNTLDGLMSRCKECQKKSARQHYHAITAAAAAATANVQGNPLAAFSPRQLIDELRRRGYTGELKYTNIIKL